MSALVIVAALAAQAGTAAALAPPSDSAAPVRTAGQSTYVDIDGGVGYSTNPQLSFVDDEGSGFGRISLHAVHSRVSARSTTVLSGYVDNVSYFTGHGSQQSVDLSARHDTALSEKVRLFGDVDASYQEGGQLGTRILGVPLVPPPPGGDVTPPILFPGGGGDFLSVTGRTYRLAGHVGGSFALGPRDSLTLTSGAERVVFHGGGGVNDSSYTTVPVSIGYDRQLSPRTTVGARLVAQDTEYDGPASVRVITPQVTGRVLLAERVTLSGAVGASFSRVDDGLVIRHSTGLSAQASLCGQGERDFYCARVSADQQTATVAGPAKSISAGIDYSRQLDANQSIQASLSAERYSTPISVISGRTFSSSSYYRAAGAYTRRIDQRLFGGVNLAARKLAQNGPDPKTDLNASLFIRYRLGDVQ
jgi:hypothetical protein